MSSGLRWDHNLDMCAEFSVEGLDYSKIFNFLFWTTWILIVFCILIKFVGVEFIVDRTKEVNLYKYFFLGFSLWLLKSLISNVLSIFQKNIIINDRGIKQYTSGREILFKDVDTIHRVMVYNMYNKLAYLTPGAIVLIVLSFFPFGWILFSVMFVAAFIIKILIAVYCFSIVKCSFSFVDIIYDSIILIDSYNDNFVTLNRISLYENLNYLPDEIKVLISKAEKKRIFL